MGLEASSGEMGKKERGGDREVWESPIRTSKEGEARLSVFLFLTSTLL